MESVQSTEPNPNLLSPEHLVIVDEFLSQAIVLLRTPALEVESYSIEGDYATIWVESARFKQGDRTIRVSITHER